MPLANVVGDFAGVSLISPSRALLAENYVYVLTIGCPRVGRARWHRRAFVNRTGWTVAWRSESSYITECAFDGEHVDILLKARDTNEYIVNARRCNQTVNKKFCVFELLGCRKRGTWVTLQLLTLWPTRFIPLTHLGTLPSFEFNQWVVN